MAKRDLGLLLVDMGKHKDGVQLLKAAQETLSMASDPSYRTFATNIQDYLRARFPGL